MANVVTETDMDGDLKAKAMVIHLLSLSKRHERTTHTHTYREKARTSGRKAVIMSPGLYCGYIMSFPHQTAAPV